MAGNGEVLEGFICPICMTDFKAPNHLTKHFEEVHNDDPEILKSLKGIHSSFRLLILLFYRKRSSQSFKVVLSVTKPVIYKMNIAELACCRFVWQSQEKDFETG